MRRIAFVLVAVAILTGVIALMAPAAGSADDEAALLYGIKISPGGRNWKLISVTHEEGSLNGFRVVLGNDGGIKAYCEGRCRSQTEQHAVLHVEGTPESVPA
jgi:hypothetical protein